MPKEYYDRKDKNFSFRLNRDEYSALKELAKKSYMNVSEYIRARIWETIFSQIPIEDESDPKAKFACGHDREMMCILMREFLFVKELARKGLEPELFEKCNEQALHMLRKWGYEK